MIYLIKKYVRPFIPYKILILRRRLLGKIQLKVWQKCGILISDTLREWQQDGCPIPPPHIVKQVTIQEYRHRYNCMTLIETGTYLGDMVEAQKKLFHKIISIELGVDLFNKAQQRFSNDSNVTILQGDSGEVLPEVIEILDQPALFWLDGHYSSGITAIGDKECPIFEELDTILSKKFNHIILIDDARCFNNTGDYPSIGKLTEYIKSRNEKYKVKVKHDIIRFFI